MNNSFQKKLNNTSSKIKNVANNISNKGSKMKNTITNTVSNSVSKVKNTVNNSVSKISNKVNEKTNIKEKANNLKQNISSFEQNNTAISKVVFILVIIIIFGLLFRLGVYLISLFIMPNKNPIVVDGMRSLLKGKKYTVNPTNKEPKPILRSINEDQGMEFTWSHWLFINSTENTITKEYDPTGDLFNENDNTKRLIFSKDKTYDNKNNSISSPGLYLKDDNTLELEFGIYNENINDISDLKKTIIIPNIPIQKWVCIVIKVQNKTIDIYINGMLTKRENMNYVIKQNYGDIYVGDKTSFDGYISDLRYFNYAINNNEIFNILNNGPNLKMEDVEYNDTKNTDYLSMRWYLESNRT